MRDRDEEVAALLAANAMARDPFYDKTGDGEYNDYAAVEKANAELREQVADLEGELGWHRDMVESLKDEVERLRNALKGKEENA